MLYKIENGILSAAPTIIKLNNKQIINPTIETLKELGYKEVIESEMPSINEYQYLTTEYVDSDKIYVNYKVNNVDYNEAVNEEIRKKYSLSEELAISRQRDTKPEEFKAFYDYCENCKRIVKEAQNGKSEVL